MNSFAHKRQQILQQMEQIQSMEFGSLQEENRPSKTNPSQPNGPYFKHQVWENGKNVTRRVPANQAGSLAQAIAGRKLFERLAQEFIETSVALTRAQGEATPLKKNESRSKAPSSRKAPV